MTSFKTLFRYLMRHYMTSFLATLSLLWGIAYLFDTIELLRRFAKVDSPAGMELVLAMAGFKLPEVGQELIPFAVLISAVYCLWRLTSLRELVVMRAFGLSAWRFTAPLAACGLLIGIAQIVVINPVGALMLDHFNELENRYLEQGQDLASLAETGLWLREPYQDGTMIFHAARVKPLTWDLETITVLFYDTDHQLLQRMDAGRAKWDNDGWLLMDTWLNTPTQSKPEKLSNVHLPTRFSPIELEQRLADPLTISFWRLPQYIEIVRQTGLPSAPLRAWFYELLARPLLYMVLTLVAAGLVLQPPRMMRGTRITLGALIVAFLIFFFGDLLQALGISDKLPLPLTAFAPSLVLSLFGMSIILHREDG